MDTLAMYECYTSGSGAVKTRVLDEVLRKNGQLLVRVSEIECEYFFM